MSRCECDYDGEFNDIDFRYVKCSHYCPEHDTCESCMEDLGVIKDPTYANAKGTRAEWLCMECAIDYVQQVTDISDAKIRKTLLQSMGNHERPSDD